MGGWVGGWEDGRMGGRGAEEVGNTTHGTYDGCESQPLFPSERAPHPNPLTHPLRSPLGCSHNPTPTGSRGRREATRDKQRAAGELTSKYTTFSSERISPHQNNLLSPSIHRAVPVPSRYGFFFSGEPLHRARPRQPRSFSHSDACHLARGRGGFRPLRSRGAARRRRKAQ